MTPPLVTVIIATFNRAGTIRGAIESVLGQTLRDLELIVVDDGSTDGTPDLLASINDPRLRVEHQGNQGLPSAWNLGIHKGRGRLIAFLDSDDCWLPEKLDRQVSFLRSSDSRRPGCVTGYELRTARGKIASVIPTPSHASSRAILWNNTLHLGTTFLCRAETFRSVGGFDLRLLRGQDTDWLLRYIERFDMGIVPEVLAAYHQHLARPAEALEQSRLYFIEKHRDRFQQQGRVFHARKLADTYRDLAYQFSRAGNAQKAHRYARLALESWPLAAPGLWLLLADSVFGTRLKPALDRRRYPGGRL